MGWEVWTVDSNNNRTHAVDGRAQNLGHRRLVERWKNRLGEFERFGALVTGATICSEVVQDLEALADQGEQLLNLTQAAVVSGYTREHLGRLVTQGTIPNAGRVNAPKIRRSDLPVKRGHLPLDAAPPTFSDTRRRQIVRSAVDSERSS